MANTKPVGLIGAKLIPVIRAMVRDYQAGRLTNRPESPQRRERRGPTVYLAKVTTAAITASGTGEVTLQNPDWTAITGAVIGDVINDSGVELAVGTRVYIIRIGGEWRIFWAAVCTEGA